MTPATLRWHQAFEQAVMAGMDEHAAECEADRIVPEYRTHSLRNAIVQDMTNGLLKPGHAPISGGYAHTIRHDPDSVR